LAKMAVYSLLRGSPTTKSEKEIAEPGPATNAPVDTTAVNIHVMDPGGAAPDHVTVTPVQEPPKITKETKETKEIKEAKNARTKMAIATIIAKAIAAKEMSTFNT